MLFAGALISAIAIFLGIFTKLPQGGGGLINNLMVMSCFYTAPPLLPPPPPPRAILLDLDSSVFETRQYYIHNLQSTGNFTEEPMPSPLAKPRAAPGSKNPPAPNSTFSLPDFSFPAFSPPFDVYQLCFTMGEILARIAMVFFALCLPWLAARQMYLLQMTVSDVKTTAADISFLWLFLTGTPLVIASGFEQKFRQIKPHNPLLDDLKIAISERNKALVKLTRILKKSKEVGKKALERDLENEVSIEELRKEREDLLAELARCERDLVKLQKEKKDEVEGLKKEITKQARAWEGKEKGWVETKAADEKRNQEENDSLEMERDREKDNWTKQVERLEVEKKGEKEEMETKLKNVMEGMKKERERWEMEREGWKKEKDEAAKEEETIDAERRKAEQMTGEEKKSWEEANDRAQGRIVELADENTRLTNAAAEREQLDHQREAERKVSEAARAGEQKRWEGEVQAGVKKTTSKLEEEILNGRKLIEGLQSDKRRDRQLLLELRAQLVRPTHAAPPKHINPLRFGGSAQAAYGAPFVATSPTAPSASSPASPKGTLPTIFPSNPPQAIYPTTPSADAVNGNHNVDTLFASLTPRPIFRLPPPPPPREQPAPSLAPQNAPKGPKGWKPGPSGGA